MDKSKKILVAYFSCSGRTRSVAESLAQVMGAELHEILPAVPYTRADLDWRDKHSRSSVEMHDPSFRPPLAKSEFSLAEYDVVFVGFPIWWYVAPTIINSFLEAHDFAGKVIVPFATSGGSGLGKTVEHLRGSVSESADLRQGKLLNSNPSRAELLAWVESLAL